MLEAFTLLIFVSYILFGIIEYRSVKKYRAQLEHIIYVNGTRGKSSVTRLIYAALKGGGYKCFAKTTGTVPMFIDSNGTECEIKRFGKANIKEQITALKKAAGDKASILIIECMAVDPELQWISQHKMLRADIGVITNVRLDHTDVMGNTLDEIAFSLSSTIPDNGMFFTADKMYCDYFSKICNEKGTGFCLAESDNYTGELDLRENVALAAEIARYLKIPREDALKGIEKYYLRDPYALAVYKLENSAVVANGFSINDAMSIKIIYENLAKKYGIKKLTILINNRYDRSYRMLQHISSVVELKPHNVWIMGANKLFMSLAIKKRLKSCKVETFKNADVLPINSLNSEDFVYCIGNIALEGERFIRRIKKAGTEIV